MGYQQSQGECWGGGSYQEALDLVGLTALSRGDGGCSDGLDSPQEEKKGSKSTGGADAGKP